MLWVIGFLVLLVALSIPILSIVLDSPALKKLVDARTGELADRITSLEDEVLELNKSLIQVKEENKFMQRLLENPESRSSTTDDSSGEAGS